MASPTFALKSLDTKISADKSFSFIDKILPRELFLHIFFYISPSELMLKAKRVNRNWAALLGDKKFWNLYAKHHHLQLKKGKENLHGLSAAYKKGLRISSFFLQRIPNSHLQRDLYILKDSKNIFFIAECGSIRIYDLFRQTFLHSRLPTGNQHVKKITLRKPNQFLVETSQGTSLLITYKITEDALTFTEENFQEHPPVKPDDEILKDFEIFKKQSNSIINEKINEIKLIKTFDNKILIVESARSTLHSHNYNFVHSLRIFEREKISEGLTMFKEIHILSDLNRIRDVEIKNGCAFILSGQNLIIYNLFTKEIKPYSFKNWKNLRCMKFFHPNLYLATDQGDLLALTFFLEKTTLMQKIGKASHFEEQIMASLSAQSISKV